MPLTPDGEEAMRSGHFPDGAPVSDHQMLIFEFVKRYPTVQKDQALSIIGAMICAFGGDGVALQALRDGVWEVEIERGN
jgi:hypothetical protein